MLVPHNTTVIVADGARLAVFRNAGTAATPDYQPTAAPLLTLHAPDSGGHHRSSLSNPDRGTQAEDAHAAAVAGWVNAEVAAGRMGPVALIAPPRALGELRRHLHEPIRHKLVFAFSTELRDPTAAKVAAVVARAG